jgi:hypothetical protein
MIPASATGRLTAYREADTVEASHPMTSVPSRSAIDTCRRATAHGVAAIALLLDAAFLVLLFAAPTTIPQVASPTTVGGFVLGATFPIAGWVIASRRPGNAMGWIFLGVALSQALDTFAGQYALVGLVVAPGSLPAADLMSWVETWAWAPGFVLLLTASVLLFPDGRPPSPRWRIVLVAAAVALALLVVPDAILAWPSRGPELLGPGPSPDNVDGAFALVMVLLMSAGLVLLLVSSAASVASLLVRFRRSSGVGRAQLKWFVAAGIVEIGALELASLVALPWPAANVAIAVAAAPLVPIAAGIAILRYRLYDIDRIISRSVAYLLVTGLLAGLFALLVVLLQGLLASFTESSAPAVAGSTLAVAAAFQPLRRRIQDTVDRRFNRARVDAVRAEAELAARIRDQLDVATLVATLATSIASSMQPQASGVWIRGTGR